MSAGAQGTEAEGLLRKILEAVNSRPAGLDQLASAYVRARAKIGSVVLKNAHNPHFKNNFADLGAVLKQIEGPFAEEGLALLQAPGKMTGDGKRIEVIGVLFHASGQLLNMTMELPIGDKATAQAAGSAITYARRYQAQAVGGLAPADDDGEAASYVPPAMIEPPKKAKAEKTEPTPAKEKPAKAKPEPEAEAEEPEADEGGGDGEEDTAESLLAAIAEVGNVKVFKDKSEGSLYSRVQAFGINDADEVVARAYIARRRVLEGK